MSAASTFQSERTPATKASDVFRAAAFKSVRQPRQVKIKSRNRLFGKRTDKDEILKVIADLATSGLKTAAIAKETGKDTSTIRRYLRQAAEAGLIKRSESGLVEVSEQVQLAREYATLQLDSFVQEYPIVKEWVDNMRTRKGGKPIRAWRGYLSHLKTICDTLELSPYAIVSGSDNAAKVKNLEKVIQEISKAIQENRLKKGPCGNKTAEEHQPHIKNYVMPLRDFAMSSGVTIQRGMGGILSGKKVNFGRYAGVKMSDAQIDQAVKLLGERYGYASIEQAGFVFYYLTAARQTAGILAEAHYFNRMENGWYTTKVYESKTEKTWPKFIPADNPHQKILLDYLEGRKGKRFLWLENGDKIEVNNMKQRFVKAFRGVYETLKLPDEYFYKKPAHSTRHIGAHYWLRRTNYNHGIVAKIGGWDDVQTLVSCYGEIPEDMVMQSITGMKVAIA